ncbi:hypothetical protein TUM12149_03660 [Morganella morganii]|nr:hypothetical protein TUM12149_03660 [Morganella morganii]GIZ29918.1 hypothetical protein TUM12150_04040 [Morganella morganii]
MYADRWQAEGRQARYGAAASWLYGEKIINPAYFFLADKNNNRPIIPHQKSNTFIFNPSFRIIIHVTIT